MRNYKTFSHNHEALPFHLCYKRCCTFTKCLPPGWHHGVGHVIPPSVCRQSQTSQFSVSPVRWGTWGIMPEITPSKHTALPVQGALFSLIPQYLGHVSYGLTGGEHSSWVVSAVFTQRPPIMSVMMPFVCIVFLKSLSPWDFAPNGSARLEMTTFSSTVAPTLLPPSKEAAKPKWLLFGPWNVQTGGVQWENQCTLIPHNQAHRQAVDARLPLNHLMM